MIGMSAALYLKIGGALGAFLFSVGLLTILSFKFKLFTGKAGLLAKGEIDLAELGLIWCGNFAGCALASCLVGDKVAEAARRIVEIRIGNLWYQNVLMGIFCGILMYIAVTAGKDYLAAMCVMAFILFGANHCVADMAYLVMSGVRGEEFGAGMMALLSTTLGNVIGCNILPIFVRFGRTK